MPPPLDLTGRTFGRLTVLTRGPRVKFGRWQQGWRCRCSCGAELVVPQDRLPHRPSIPADRVIGACPVCRGRPCVVCGSPVPLTGDGHGRRATCSPACRDAHRKARQLASWRKRVARDPDLTRRMNERRRERAASDPEYAERVRTWERERQERRKERARRDPEYAEAIRRKNRATYARHAERIQDERRAKLDRLSPAELQAWLARARRYTREWRRRHMADLRGDPEAYARYRQIRNEYHRAYHRLRTGPPPERECVVCGAVFADHRFRVLCGRPECKAAYERNKTARARARAARAAFARIERELNDILRGADRVTTCPDKL